MKTFKIREFDHNSSPRILKFGKERLDIRFAFAESCGYAFEDGYAGWNKLVSIKYLTWKKNELAIAWRYNPNTEWFQIAPIATTEDWQVLPTGAYIRVAPNVITEASLFTENKKLFVASGSDVLYVPIDKLNKGKLPSIVGQPYFGGKYPAPHYMEIGLEFL